MIHAGVATKETIVRGINNSSFKQLSVFCFRDLSYNEITSVPADSVSSLPYLRILQLDNNKINCIDKNAFTGNKKLFNRLFVLLCSMKNDAMLRLSDVPRPLYLYRHGYEHFLNGLRCAGSHRPLRS